MRRLIVILALLGTTLPVASHAAPGEVHVATGSLISLFQLTPISFFAVDDPSGDPGTAGNGLMILARFAGTPNARAIRLTCVYITPTGDGHTLYASGNRVDLPDEDWYIGIYDSGPSLDLPDTWTLIDYPQLSPCGAAPVHPLFSQQAGPDSFHIAP